MDLLRQESLVRQVRPGQPDVVGFHRAFVGSVGRHGRVFELGMLARYKSAALFRELRQGVRLKDLLGRLWEDVRLGWAMFRRGRLRLWPARIRAKQEIRQMARIASVAPEEQPSADPSLPAAQAQSGGRPSA